MTKLLNGSEKETRTFLVHVSHSTVPHETKELQAVSKHTETCELCAGIHYVLTRPDASRKLRGKLERFT